MAAPLNARLDERFDPADAGMVQDPYPVYRRYQGEPGLHWAAGNYWVATRHADVRQVLMNRDFGQGDFVPNIQLFYPPDFDVLNHSAYRWLSEIFVMQDPPRHTRLRKLVSYALTAKRISDMQPRIEAITCSLLDAVVSRRHMEVLSDFAYQLPTRVMCDMLGVDESARTTESLHNLTQAIAEAFLVFETRALSAQMDFLFNYFGELFDRRKADPQGDLTSALAVPSEDGDSLSRRELITVVIGMFGAGFETTAHMVSNGLLTLQRHPAQWRKLVADPSLAANAVEEILRFESSLQATYRTALVDAEVGGTRVSAGQRVLCVLGAANRDPAFVPDPDNFDITRRDLRILSFGGGIHQCIGQQLARLEGKIAFTEVARRIPDMRLDTLAARWRPGFLFRGLTGLHAAW
jgi:cytochrome P450